MNEDLTLIILIGIVVSETSSLRQAYKEANQSSLDKLIPFQPTLTLPVPLRISHIAFTADENYLVLGAQVGGLAVYSVDNIMSAGPSAKPAFELGTGPLVEMK